MSRQVLRSLHVGVANRGAVHRRVYHASADWEVVGLVDISDDALAQGRAETGLSQAACFRSLEEALEKVSCDAVVISTPPQFHAAQVETALRHGRHVFVEKPFTYDLEEAERLVALARAKSLCLLVGQNDRLNPVAVAFQQAVRSGAYGRLGYVVVNHFKARRAPYPTTPHMHLWQQGVHQIDTLLAIVGQEVTEVRGESFRPPWCDWPSESSVLCHLTFADGVRGTYFGTSNAQSAGSTLMLRAEFEKGALVYDSAQGGLQFLGKEGAEQVALPKASGNEELARLFHRYIVTGEEPPMSGRNNLTTLRVIDALIRSTESGASVRFEAA